jgi:hypothetical protein
VPAAVGLLVLSACQATVRVDVAVNPGGSGTVSVTASLDASAAQAVGPLQLSDLEQAGWRIDGPHPTAGGGLTVTASKPFRNPAEAEQVIDEISGPSGPFHDLHVSRQRSVLGSRTTIRVSGAIDLTCGVQCFTDPALQQQLAAAGASAGTGLPPDVNLAFDVGVHLPNKTASWRGRLGDKTTLAATSQTWDTSRIVIVGVVAAVVVLFVFGGLFVTRRRAHRPRHARRSRSGPR